MSELLPIHLPMSRATTQLDSVRYAVFKPDLSSSLYDTGDIYSSDYNDPCASFRRGWNVTGDRPYLEHVKMLSRRWPHLRLLADFMEVGTTPIRWKQLQLDPSARDRRAEKTNVTRLDYFDSGKMEQHDCRTPEALSGALSEEVNNGQGDKVTFRLFVVEDLSRDVIELLGAKFDIPPAFFREHIVDYAWYNVRDPWVDPPNFDMAIREQGWLQFRFVTARYFETTAQFEAAREEAKSFNVLRRPDDDQNNKTLWDKQDAFFGITRARATFWFKKAEGESDPTVGVLLLDPTIKQGSALWRGYRNWECTPSIHTPSGTADAGPPRTSFFDDFIYWSHRQNKSRSPTHHEIGPPIHIPVQVLFHLICVEWFTMAEYIRARLGQIDWEVAFPEHFLRKEVNVDIALRKLHVWRRLVPLYREMLTDTLRRLSNMTCYDTAQKQSGTASCKDDGFRDPPESLFNRRGSISPFHVDIQRALESMEEYQQRIDRLTSVVTAIITIADSRRGLTDNKNLARITWLAMVFIPLSFVAGLFSMQDDITKLSETLKWYSAAAFSLAAVVLALALTLTYPKTERSRFNSGRLDGAQDIGTRAHVSNKYDSMV